EGGIPEGYGAGIVMLWDRGTWHPEVSDIDAALEKGDLKFTLDGVKLKGSWVLIRTRGPYSRRSTDDESSPSRSWLLIKHRDEWAGNLDVSTKFPDSVKSFKDFPQILADEKVEVWQSHKPVEGGATGKLLQQIIDEAAKLKAS